MPTSEPTPGNALPEHVQFKHHDMMLRANLYQFLAGAYLSPPNIEFVDQIQDLRFIEQIEMLLGEEIVAPLHDIAASFDSKEQLTALQQEFMDLFTVPAGRYVTPFEDVYRGLRLDGKQERGPLLGDRAVTVKVFYCSAGANLDTTCKELPTHIGVELSFMSFLCEQEKQAQLEDTQRDRNNKLSKSNTYRLWQLKFLYEHLTDWFPQLNQAIQSNAITCFYRSLAQVTENFLIQDKDRLKEQLEIDLQAVNTTAMER